MIPVISSSQKNPRPRAGASRPGTELRPGRLMGGRRQECHWQAVAAYAVAGTAAVVGRRAGTGRVRDEHPRRAWQLGAQAPRHPVSNGDAAIVAGIDPVYGRGVPHQLCVFHLRREYWRNLGAVGFAEAKRLLRSDSLAEGREWAWRLVRLTAGTAGKAGYGRDGTQPAGAAANPGPAQTNHLTGNATRQGW